LLQLEILYTAAYSTLKTGWYAQLMAWAEALFAIIGEDFKTNQTPGFPTEVTRKALTEIENSHNPVSAIYALQLTIKESTKDSVWASVLLHVIKHGHSIVIEQVNLQVRLRHRNMRNNLSFGCFCLTSLCPTSFLRYRDFLASRC